MYGLLYSKSLNFWIYGIIYGTAAILLFIYFSNAGNNYLPLTFLQEGIPRSLGTAVICGVGARAILSINFYESRKNTDGKLSAFGPQYIKDRIEQWTCEKINPSVPLHYNIYIDKKIKIIAPKVDLAKMKEIFVGRYGKDEIEKLPEIKSLGLVADINKLQSPEDLSRWIINKWGIEYYSNFILYCKKSVNI